MRTESHLVPLKQLVTLIREQLAKSRYTDDAEQRDAVVRIAIEALANLESLFDGAIKLDDMAAQIRKAG